MSDPDLNIRAAKCLGWRWEIDEHVKDEAEEMGIIIHGGMWEINQDYYDLLGEIYWDDMHDGNFKFTTSYDWAMLGVKECYDDILLRFELTKKFNDNIINMFSATPEQITQAWVEVLERQ